MGGGGDGGTEGGDIEEIFMVGNRIIGRSWKISGNFSVNLKTAHVAKAFLVVIINLSQDESANTNR